MCVCVCVVRARTCERACLCMRFTHVVADIGGDARAHTYAEEHEHALYICTDTCVRIYRDTYVCAGARAYELNFLRRAAHDVEATLARHGGHDSMTSTGRVLFSKGDSMLTTPRGEIAKRYKQPEHVVRYRTEEQRGE